jgi:hypothetical protein
VRVLLVLAFASRCVAQTAPDPLAAPTYSRVYAIGERVFDAGAATDLASAMYVGQLGVGRAALTVRGRVSGLPGTFDSGDIKTYRSLEGEFLPNYVFAGGGGVFLSAGPLIGSSLSFDTKGAIVTTPHQFTLGACGLLNGPGVAAVVCLGQHQALSGFAGMGTLHIAMTKYVSFIADGGVGRACATTSAPGSCSSKFLRLGFAVQVAE